MLSLFSRPADESLRSHAPEYVRHALKVHTHPHTHKHTHTRSQDTHTHAHTLCRLHTHTHTHTRLRERSTASTLLSSCLQKIHFTKYSGCEPHLSLCHIHDVICV